MIERTNAATRPSSPRSSRSSSTTARDSRSSSRVRPSTGWASGCASTSTRRLPSGPVLAAPIRPRWRPSSVTARPPPGSRTRSTTSATVPTEAKSSPLRGTSTTRSSVPTSIANVTVIVGKTTESSTGTNSMVSIAFSKFWGESCLLNVSEYRDGKCRRPAPSAPPAKLAPVSDAREAAAAAAAELVEPGMTIGLGSGRAVWAMVERLPRGTRAVVASERTRERALAAGVEVVELDGSLELDLALDGADEVDGSLGLIKGGGGALLREKIVISAARRFVVVAETAKLVDRLGQRCRLPVEVISFAWRDTRRRLLPLLPDAELRHRDDGEPYSTDEGHFILDCAIPDGADVDLLARSLKTVTGVVEHGLFLGMAERALLGTPDGGVERLARD